MIVGVPKEIKKNENRIAIVPAGVNDLVRKGHQVLVETKAGVGSGFSDKDFIEAGATMIDSAKEIYSKADMIVKVKEPLKEEYDLIRAGQIVFTYFHFASSLELTQAMIKSKATCIAYETVKAADNSLPLLTPMSEIAGRMAAHEAAKYLEKHHGGKGKLMGGVPGVLPAKVLVLGAGVVGTQAAKIAAGLGADVYIFDINLNRLRYLDDVMPKNVRTVFSSPYNIKSHLHDTDAIIGAVLIPGAKAPKMITKDMLALMQPGTVMIDVAVDQGGAFETTRATTHENPVFILEDIVHYCVANMPGAVPFSSTVALTNATLPYVIQIAEEGWQNACQHHKALKQGLNITDGAVVSSAVANAFGLPHSVFE